MTTLNDQIELFTIGHSNLAADDVVANLREHEIGKVVDVRSSPHSRFSPQFNQRAFEQTLRDAGIDYVFAGDALGGRPADPTCYKNGELPPSKSDYLKLVDYGIVATRPWYLDGVEQLVEMARENRIAIMCSEEDPTRCHRHHLIAQTLLDRGVAVWHIRKSGECETATMLENGQSAEPRPEQAALF